MHVTRVQYTVQSAYARSNIANIEKVMDALQDNPIDGLRYSSFCRSDGRTFVHIVVASSQEAQAKISELPEFQRFQQALISSEPTAPPSVEEWSLVGTSQPV